MTTPPETRVEFALRQTNRFLAVLGVACLVCLTALVTVNVMLRYLMNAPLSWADEFSSYFLVGMVFLGLAYALQDDAHIKVDFLVILLPERAQRLLAIGAHVVGLFFSVLLVLGAYSRVRSFYVLNTQSMGEFEFPLYLPSLVLLLGTCMFLLVMLARTVRLIASQFAGGNGAGPAGSSLP